MFLKGLETFINTLSKILLVTPGHASGHELVKFHSQLLLRHPQKDYPQVARNPSWNDRNHIREMRLILTN